MMQCAHWQRYHIIDITKPANVTLLIVHEFFDNIMPLCNVRNFINPVNVVISCNSVRIIHFNCVLLITNNPENISPKYLGVLVSSLCFAH